MAHIICLQMWNWSRSYINWKDHTFMKIWAYSWKSLVSSIYMSNQTRHRYKLCSMFTLYQEVYKYSENLANLKVPDISVFFFFFKQVRMNLFLPIWLSNYIYCNRKLQTEGETEISKKLRRIIWFGWFGSLRWTKVGIDGWDNFDLMSTVTNRFSEVANFSSL